MLANLILLGLGTWQTVDVLHHSQLFYPFRKEAEHIREIDQSWRGLFAARGFLCPYCLSIWVAMGYAALLCTPLAGLVSWFLLALAGSKLANLGNDLLKADSHPPRYEPEASAE